MSIIRASDLELEASDCVVRLALRPNIDHLLNIIELGEVPILSGVIVSLLGTGLSGMTTAQSEDTEKILTSISYRLQT